MATVPKLRRPFLYLPDPAGPQGRKGHGDPDRTAPAVLYRPHRHRADRGSGAGTELVADAVLYGVQGAGRGPHPHFQTERAIRADHRDPRGSPVRTRADGRGRSRRARASGAAHLCQPADAVGRDRVDLVDGHRVRRDLPASSSRGEGKSPQRLSTQKNRTLRSCLFVITRGTTSIVAAVEAVMMVMVMVVITTISGHHDD